jgi:putative DNA primase/helicase
MSEAVERILSALDAHGFHPRRSGSGWMARCPAHDDRRASLSVNQGGDGRILVHCHAGCSTEQVVAALGLTMADLMPSGNGAKTPRPNGRGFATANEAVAVLEGKLGRRSALWTYRDAHGEPVGVIVRWDLPDGKTIRPVSRAGDRWTISAMSEPRPLYRLPEILAAPLDVPIVIVEGEKSADAAWQCGLVATTSAGGAKAASKTDWGPLRGRRVVILPDHDEPGERYAEDVAKLALATGAKDVRILRLADHAANLPDGGDLADVVADDRWRGLPLGDAAAPADLVRWILATAETIEPRRPDPAAEAIEPALRCLADIEAVSVNWLWPNRLPLGRLSVLAGRPGSGKTWLSLDLAARVTTGDTWPDDTAGGRPGDVLLLSGEDDPGDTLRPRLEAAGANLERVHILDGRKSAPHPVPITLQDVDVLNAALGRLPECRLLVIDPIGTYLGGRIDAHRDNELRSVLAPIAGLASRRQVAVLLVAHVRKSSAPFADDTVLGSVGLVGQARAVYHVLRDPEDRDRRLLLPGKNNLAKEQQGLAFYLAGQPAAVHWAGCVDVSADELLARMGEARPEVASEQKLLAWIAQQGGAVTARDVTHGVWRFRG